MTGTFGSNIAALRAQRSLASATTALSRSFERLSSGQRINRASDDAAGLSIADSLRTRARLQTTAIRNVNDGLSMLNIIDSSIGNQSNVIQRLTELAEQSANGTYSATQRSSLQNEYNALLEEFGRLGDTTSFNSLNLLRANRIDGVSDILLQAGVNGSIDSLLRFRGADTGSYSGTIDLYPATNFLIDDVVAVENFEDITDLFNSKLLRITVQDSLNQSHDLIVGLALDVSLTELKLVVFGRGAEVDGGSQEWALLSADLFSGAGQLVTDSTSGLLKLGSANPVVDLVFNSGATAQTSIDLSGFRFAARGNVDGPSEGPGQNPETDLSGTTAIDFTGVESVDRARFALTILRNRLNDLASIRGSFGALASRLETAVSTLQVSKENSLAAESRIRDVDISEESARLTAHQILQRTSQAVLAQANQQPGLLLRLLQQR